MNPPPDNRISRISRIPIKGPIGLVFTLAMLIIVLVALPAARWFLAISVVLGVMIGLVLHLIRRGR